MGENNQWITIYGALYTLYFQIPFCFLFNLFLHTNFNIKLDIQFQKGEAFLNPIWNLHTETEIKFETSSTRVKLVSYLDGSYYCLVSKITDNYICAWWDGFCLGGATCFALRACFADDRHTFKELVCNQFNTSAVEPKELVWVMLLPRQVLLEQPL